MTTTSDGSGFARRTKINSSDPSLTAVWTAYPAQPLLALFHPPIELASSGPRGCLNFNRWIDCTAIRLAVQTRIEILHSGPVGWPVPGHWDLVNETIVGLCITAGPCPIPRRA
jgi:hypothetical protein